MKKLGIYEVYIATSLPKGQQGSEGCRVLSFIPHKMLSFEWSVPPNFKQLREQHPNSTWIVLLFDDIGDGKIKVTLYHYDFGTGEEWKKVYKYFDSAWSYVLGRLKTRFEKGTLDWNSKN